MSMVDERIVEMRFDNQNFESNIKKSTASLESLKAALDLDDAADGFNKIEESAKNLDLGGLTNVCEKVSSGFNAMEVMAISALSNITNSAMNAAKQMMYSLTTAQRVEGWNKYGTKTSSVQTIVSAGYELEEVTEQIEKLNWFTDETSYSLTDMVDNIGKFTANGIELDKAASAMQGISTWAAMSGQNATAASRAMYNLSQAIGVGSVKLMDWRSIQNANMATQQFKQTAMDTAVELGVLEKAGEGVYKTLEGIDGVSAGTEVTMGKFDESLSSAWFSADVLMKTLGKYGGFADQLYEATEALDVGATDLLEAIDLYSEKDHNGLAEWCQRTGVEAAELNKHLQKLSASELDLGRKAFKAAQQSKTFEDVINYTKDAVSSGWMQTYEKIFGNYEEAVQLWTRVSNEMYELFVRSGEERNAMLDDWRDASKDGIDGRAELLSGIDALWTTISGIMFSIRDAWKEVFRVMTGSKLKQMTVAFSKWANSLRWSDEKIAAFKDRVVTAFQGIKNIGEKLRLTLNDIAYAAGFATGKIYRKFMDAWPSIKATGEKIYDNVKNLIAKLPSLEEVMWGVGYISGLIAPKLKSVVDSVKEFGITAKQYLSSKITPIVDRLKAFYNSFGGDEATTFKDKVKVLAAMMPQLFRSLLDSLNTKVWQPILSRLGKFWNGFKNIMTGLYNFAVNNHLWNKLVSASLFTITGMFFTSLAKLMNSLSKGITGFSGIFEAITKRIKGFGKSFSTSTLKISASLLLLATAFKMLANIPVDSAKRAAITMGALLAAMVAVYGLMTAISSLNKGAASRGSLSLLAMAGSLFLLVMTLKSLQNVDFGSWTDWGQKIGAIVALLAGLAIAAGLFAAMPKATKGAISSIIMLVGIVLALKSLAKLLNSMELSSALSNGGAVLGLIGLMLGMSEIIKSISKINFAKFGLGVLAITAGIGLLMMAFKSLGESKDMDWTNVLAGFVIMLGAIFLLSKIVKGAKSKISAKDATGMAVSMFAMVGAISALMLVLHHIGTGEDINMDNLAKLSLCAGLLMIAMGAMMSLANTYANSGSKGKISGALLGIVAMIGIMTAIVTALSLMPESTVDTVMQNVWRLVGVIGVLAAIFGALSLVTGAASKLGGGKLKIGPIVAAAVALAALSAVMVFMANACQPAELQAAGSAIESAGVAILVTLIGLSIMFAVLGSINLDAGKAWGVVGIILSIAAAMAIIAYTLQSLTNTIKEADSADLNSALGVMFGSIVTLGIAVAAMAMLSPAAGAALATMGLLLALCIGLAIIGESVDTFANVNWDALSSGIETFTSSMSQLTGEQVDALWGTVGVLAVLSVVGIAAAIGLIGVATAAAIFAVALLVAAVAVTIAAGGIYLLAGAVEALSGIDWSNSFVGFAGAMDRVKDGVQQAAFNIIVLGAAAALVAAAFAACGAGVTVTAGAFGLIAIVVLAVAAAVVIAIVALNMLANIDFSKAFNGFGDAMGRLKEGTDALENINALELFGTLISITIGLALASGAVVLFSGAMLALAGSVMVAIGAMRALSDIIPSYARLMSSYYKYLKHDDLEANSWEQFAESVEAERENLENSQEQLKNDIDTQKDINKDIKDQADDAGKMDTSKMVKNATNGFTEGLTDMGDGMKQALGNFDLQGMLGGIMSGDVDLSKWGIGAGQEGADSFLKTFNEASNVTGGLNLKDIDVTNPEAVMEAMYSQVQEKAEESSVEVSPAFAVDPEVTNATESATDILQQVTNGMTNTEKVEIPDGVLSLGPNGEAIDADTLQTYLKDLVSGGLTNIDLGGMSFNMDSFNGEAMQSQMETAIKPLVESSFTNAGNAGVTSFQNADWGAAGESAVDQMVVGIQSKTDAIQSQFDTIADNIKLDVNLENVTLQTDTLPLDDIQAQIETAITPQIESAVANAASTSLTTFVGAGWDTTGASSAELAISGIESADWAGAGARSASAAASAGISAFESAGWSGAGANAASGLASGVSSGTGAVVAAFSAMATEALSTVMGIWDIHSPSREFFKVGAFAIQGLTNGVNRERDRTIRAFDNIALTSTKRTRELLGNLGAGLTTNLSRTMTVRPVLDLTNAVQETGRLNSMIDNTHMLAAEVSTQIRNENTTMIELTRDMLKAIRDGKTIILDGQAVASSVNRRLGAI